ncbi:MAG: type II toxin-antitoxin system ParD family antitoxin [Isosphaeraceae bacterium]|nr:type II toxin-antitoxin system ParD family antitoxin [Isosphaeraceae bacterium]
MTTMTISLSDSPREFIEEQSAKQGYGMPDDYVRALIREAQKREAKARLEALLLEGLNSGPAEPMTAEDWAEMRCEFDERHGRPDGR